MSSRARIVDVSTASLVARQARSKLKQRARSGEITVGEVIIANVDIMGPVRLADILDWGWPGFGPVRQMKVGKVAARRDINVLLPVGKASRATRTAFVNIVGEVRGEPQQWASKVAEDESRDDEVERLSWLLKRTEAERDGAFDTIADLERTMSVQQIVMPALDAERMVADLADAIEVHKRTVTSPSPPEKWCTADEELWEAKNTILAGRVPNLRAVA